MTALKFNLETITLTAGLVTTALSLLRWSRDLFFARKLANRRELKLWGRVKQKKSTATVLPFVDVGRRDCFCPPLRAPGIKSVMKRHERQQCNMTISD